MNNIIILCIINSSSDWEICKYSYLIFFVLSLLLYSWIFIEWSWYYSIIFIQSNPLEIADYSRFYYSVYNVKAHKSITIALPTVLPGYIQLQYTSIYKIEPVKKFEKCVMKYLSWQSLGAVKQILI